MYRFLIFLRNRFYDIGILKSSALSVPVLCVGNITTGGTGKTPMVIWLCRYLREQGKKVVLLSRGYKGRADTGNDEIQMFRETLPDVPVVIDSNRVRGGREAIRKYSPDVMVLDDGFQHRRLRRDFDIVMIDCTCPFGYRYMLPRGLLREPLSGLRRAGAIVLSRSDQVSSEELSGLKDRLKTIMETTGGEQELLLATSRHQPVALYNAEGKETSLEEVSGRKVAAFCGIGNPESFTATLEQLDAVIVGQEIFTDHASYPDTIADRLGTWRRKTGADWLVTTEKDWVKLREIPNLRTLDGFHWLKVEMVLTGGCEPLQKKIEHILTG